MESETESEPIEIWRMNLTNFTSSSSNYSIIPHKTHARPLTKIVCALDWLIIFCYLIGAIGCIIAAIFGYEPITEFLVMIVYPRHNKVGPNEYSPYEFYTVLIIESVGLIIIQIVLCFLLTDSYRKRSVSGLRIWLGVQTFITVSIGLTLCYHVFTATDAHFSQKDSSLCMVGAMVSLIWYRLFSIIIVGDLLREFEVAEQLQALRAPRQV